MLVFFHVMVKKSDVEETVLEVKGSVVGERKASCVEEKFSLVEVSF